ncbi:MAG: bifunctional metallophosphatase/5'-nucleotidase [Bdellovibrionales bacterium]|nr:bifunctional metallophosphatase/5'-nucleotidase [Bdellovibrionales bacterium]
MKPSRLMPWLLLLPAFALAHESRELVIVGINDFHGALVPAVGRAKDLGGEVEVQQGGAAWMAAAVERLRERHGKRLVVLDGGDEFQGTLESNLKQGAPVVEFFNALGVTAAAIGNHEFDYGPANPPFVHLVARLKEAHYPYLAVNIVERATGKAPAWPNVAPSALIDAGGVKVGLIGVTTESTPTTTRGEFVSTLRFVNPREGVLRESAALRKKGAKFVVVVAHAGLECNEGAAEFGLYAHRVWEPSTRQAPCGMDEEIPRLLAALPQGTLDAVVAGHTHQIAHHWVKGVPVIQAASVGRYLNVLTLKLGADGRPDPAAARIEGPIPVCPKVFAKQGGCNARSPEPAGGRGPLVEPELLGRKLKPHPEVQKVVDRALSATAELRARVVGRLARPMFHVRERESEMMNLIADAIRAKAKADFGLVNPGGVRIPKWESGELTFGDVYRALPFENLISTARLRGADLTRLLARANDGQKGYFGTSGLIVEMLRGGYASDAADVRLKRWPGGEALDPKKIYTLATFDFLVKGGDGLGAIFGKLPPGAVQVDGAGDARAALVEHLGASLAEGAALNAERAPLVDPKRPRLVLKR